MTMRIKKRKAPKAEPDEKPEGAKKKKSKKKGPPVPRDIQQGLVMAIDPGTSYLGWSMSLVTPVEEKFSAELVDHGTIYGVGTGSKLIAGILAELDEVIERYKPDHLAIEDYIYIPGRENGLFAIPALIGVIKYHWYLKTRKEAFTIYAATWKTCICGFPYANKDTVRESLKQRLSPEIIASIDEVYKQVQQKGEQDAIDAIAIGLYVCQMMGLNRVVNDTSLGVTKK